MKLRNAGYVFALVGLFFILHPIAALADVYPDGSVLKATDDSRVYVLEHGVKRWVETEAIFLAQGFSWSDIVPVSPHELDVYEEGAAVMDSTELDIPPEGDVLPDLIPLPISDIHFDTVNGDQVLRFSGVFWNQGPGPLEIMRDEKNPASGSVYTTSQVVYQADGSTRLHEAGTVYFHDVHDHYHLDNFSEYRLEPVSVDGDSEEVRTTKASFCMRDDVVIDSSAGGVPDSPQYTSCQSTIQGVSVGWADVYRFTLEDQYIDIENIPAGVYRLVFDVDAQNLLLEETQENNISSVLIDIDPASQSLTILGEAAPFDTEDNQLDNGLLVRGDNSSRVYVIHDGKKRWLRDEETLLSYGYAFEDAYKLPESVVDAIKTADFVRAENGDVYMLNPHGFVRRILNPDVLASYDTGDIPLINATELDSYDLTQFIQLEGDHRVYTVNTKALVGFENQLSQLDVEQLSVQKINQTDFNSYVVAVEEEGLTIPWDIAFLPDGDMLVTERPGTLQRFGNTSATISIPGVFHTGEGGLMGIAVHPDFANNNYIYLYFTSGDGSENKVVRYQLNGTALVEDLVILDSIPGAKYHDGGQIAFGPDNMLYITAGDASQAHLAQDVDSLAGKTLRVTADGDIPADNPFGSEVWSWGHRNAQGIAWDSLGNMWQTEHGRSGASSGYDELNLIERGANYGWPDIQGSATKEGMRVPKLHSGEFDTWAPSGIAYHDGTLFFSGLLGSRVYAVSISGQTPTRVSEYFTGEFGRLRAATIGPDGMLYVTTSNLDGRGVVNPGDDKVIKIAPGMLQSLND